MDKTGDEVEDVGGETPDATLGDGEVCQLAAQRVDVCQGPPAYQHGAENTGILVLNFFKVCERMKDLVRFTSFINFFPLFHCCMERASLCRLTEAKHQKLGSNSTKNIINCNNKQLTAITSQCLGKLLMVV